MSVWNTALLLHIGRIVWEREGRGSTELVVWFVGWRRQESMMNWGQAGYMVADHILGLGRPGPLGGEQVPENVRHLRSPEAEVLGSGQDRVEIRKKRLIWTSFAQGFLGRRRMADRPWGSMALS